MEQSLATNEQLRVPIRLAEAKIHEALFQVAMGDTLAAEDSVRKAEELLVELERGPVLIMLHLAKGKIQQKLGSPGTSIKVFETARDLATASGYLLLEQKARLELSRSMMESGDSARVDVELTDVIRISKRSRLRPLEGRSLFGTCSNLPSIVRLGASRCDDRQSHILGIGVWWGAPPRLR